VKKEILQFGNGAIRENEWNMLSKFIDENNIKNILEIGCGYSTILLSKKDINKLISLDTNKKWIEIVRSNLSRQNIELIEYNYPDFPNIEDSFDLVFVDGPASSKYYEGRKHSMVFAQKKAKFIAIHDYSRKEERKAIDEVFKSLLVVDRIGSLIIVSNQK